MVEQGSPKAQSHTSWKACRPDLEEHRAFAPRRISLAYWQPGVVVIPRNGVACHDYRTNKGATMTAVPEHKSPAGAPPREVRIVAHSMLFYWWPVWAVGFVMAGLTWLDGHRLAIVPADTQVVEGFDGGREALVLPVGAHLPQDPATGKPREPRIRMASHSSYGVVFVVVLLLVVFITNVPIRGLWSVVMIITVVLGTIILALAGWWDDILEAAGHSHVFINVFGYLAIALPLLILWLVAVLFFDRRMYMVFAPGQVRVHQEIGSGEVAFDTLGMVVAKKRSDLFRHWLLGFGSGDLFVKTGGSNAQQIEMHNVLFVGNKIQLIQQMLQTREVVSGA
jgi:hypothetical protein